MADELRIPVTATFTGDGLTKAADGIKALEASTKTLTAGNAELAKSQALAEAGAERLGEQIGHGARHAITGALGMGSLAKQALPAIGAMLAVEGAIKLIEGAWKADRERSEEAGKAAKEAMVAETARAKEVAAAMREGIKEGTEWAAGWERQMEASARAVDKMTTALVRMRDATLGEEMAAITDRETAEKANANGDPVKIAEAAGRATLARAKARAAAAQDNARAETAAAQTKALEARVQVGAREQALPDVEREAASAQADLEKRKKEEEERIARARKQVEDYDDAMRAKTGTQQTLLKGAMSGIPNALVKDMTHEQAMDAASGPGVKMSGVDGIMGAGKGMLKLQLDAQHAQEVLNEKDSPAVKEATERAARAQQRATSLRKLVEDGQDARKAAQEALDIAKLKETTVVSDTGAAVGAAQSAADSGVHAASREQLNKARSSDDATKKIHEDELQAIATRMGSVVPDDLRSAKEKERAGFADKFLPPSERGKHARDTPDEQHLVDYAKDLTAHGQKTVAAQIIEVIESLHKQNTKDQQRILDLVKEHKEQTSNKS